jgi:hypothetical protein
VRGWGGWSWLAGCCALQAREAWPWLRKFSSELADDGVERGNRGLIGSSGGGQVGDAEG